MFNGLYYTLLYYFGTNLLTGGPTQIVVFFLFQCFEGKGYQTESKRNETFGNVIFGTNMIQRTWSLRKPPPPPPQGAPSTLVGPTLLHRHTSSSYIYLRTPKPSQTEQNPISTTATFCTREIPSWGLFRCFAGGGIDHGGLLH